MRLKVDFGHIDQELSIGSPKEFVEFMAKNTTIPGHGEEFRKNLANSALDTGVTPTETFRFHSDKVLMDDFIEAGLLEVLDERPQV